MLSLPRRRGDDLIVTLLHYVPLRKAIEKDVLEEPMSFAGQKLKVEGAKGLRQFGEDALPGGEDGFDLPHVSGRLLLESPDYFTTEEET